jgi:hypothetical protein
MIPRLLSLVLAGSLAGCCGGAHVAARLQGHSQRGQALWFPADADALAGELIFVLAPGDEGFVIEFSKGAFPVVRASVRGSAWEIISPGGQFRRGRGSPPPILWFQLGALLSSRPVTRDWEGRFDKKTLEWWLERRSTGERAKGYLSAAEGTGPAPVPQGARGSPGGGS